MCLFNGINIEISDCKGFWVFVIVWVININWIFVLFLMLY